MRIFSLSILLILLTISPVLTDDGPEPVKVYCFSDAMEAGFKDIPASAFCAELAKRGNKKKSLIRVPERTEADAIAHFVDAEQFTEKGEAIFFSYGIAFAPNQTKNRRTAVLQVGGFAKGFSAEGVNAQASGMLVRQTEEWIRENRATILEKTSQK